MDYKSVHLIKDELVLVAPDEVAQLEQQLGTTMLPGYREYVTTLGLGILNDYVRVYMPQRILREYKDFQSRWNEYYFWEAGADVLSKDKVLESIIVADTGNGDELIFHPAQPDTLYVLPIDYGQIYQVGNSFDEAIDWILHAGVLNADEEEEEDFEWPEGLYFEPFNTP